MNDMAAGVYIPEETEPEEREYKECEDCKHRPLNWFDPPCLTCFCSCNWEAKEETNDQT